MKSLTITMTSYMSTSFCWNISCSSVLVKSNILKLYKTNAMPNPFYSIKHQSCFHTNIFVKQHLKNIKFVLPGILLAISNIYNWGNLTHVTKEMIFKICCIYIIFNRLRKLKRNSPQPWGNNPAFIWKF